VNSFVKNVNIFIPVLQFTNMKHKQPWLLMLMQQSWLSTI